jgi:hypothetical protein
MVKSAEAIRIIRAMIPINRNSFVNIGRTHSNACILVWKQNNSKIKFIVFKDVLMGFMKIRIILTAGLVLVYA